MGPPSLMPNDLATSLIVKGKNIGAIAWTAIPHNNTNLSTNSLAHAVTIIVMGAVFASI